MVSFTGTAQPSGGCSLATNRRVAQPLAFDLSGAQPSFFEGVVLPCVSASPNHTHTPE